ncbi:hypothetical protein ZTR_10159 [Talaromyces verruculosus]|nr:hypothetical protein ZTR_10159 [Talaromyces verruculosus]
MADKNDPAADKGTNNQRLKWQATDEETGALPHQSLPHQKLTRTLSTASSAASTRANRRATVDPAVTLPIHYRSLSFDIDEVRQREEIKAKNDGIAIELSNIEWHTLSTTSLEKRLEVDIGHGLSSDQIQQRLRHYGKNVLSPAPHHWFKQIFGYFFKGFGIILLIGCILVFVSWKPLGDPPAVANLALAIVLLAVFFIQAAFNAWQDWSSSRVMASITAMLPESCTVVRNAGTQMAIPAADLVPGDVIQIKAGNKLPADVSEPKPGLTLLEKEVLRFVALIVAIMLTMIIVVIIVWATWLRKDHPDWINVPTLIVDCVSVAIAFIPEGLPISITASLTITANIMRKNQILCKSLKTVETLGSVSVICSDKTGTLTRNKMFVTDCAISTSAFNSPMTARDETVIKGKSTGVHQLRALSGLCNAAEFDVAAESLPLNERPIFGDATDQAILRFSELLGSVSEMRRLWKKTWELAFNSRNKFMIRTFAIAESKGLGLALSPAESMQFKPEDTLLTIKGAPDILIERCGRVVTADGSVQTLDAETLRQIKGIKDEWSNQGKRVILLARKVIVAQDIMTTVGSNEYESEIMRQAKSDLILVGLVGIVDPPREEIPAVVKTLRRAGIRIFMVTGDFGLTALAIARQCGIVSADSVDDVTALQRYASGSDTAVNKEHSLSAIVISGSELLSLNDTQWDQLCGYQEIVFARTTPEQKLRIVREFQSREEIVGMTGDGVNDAPSLKAADIGIALGSGSDIAIEASDMVLLDSFSAIVEAVQYGRVVFDNLRKTIIYLLPAGSFSEFWPVFTNVVFGLPQVLSSFLMIVICCFTDCAAATVLAYEKPEADVLLRPPRNPRKDKLVDWKLMFHAYGVIGIIQTVCSFSMSYWYLQRNGIPFSSLWFGFGAVPAGIDEDYYSDKLNEASSIYFVNLVVMQWFNLMAIRTRRLSIFSHPPAFNKETQNLLLFPAIIFALGIAAFWLYIPRLQSVLDTTGVPVEHYFLPAAFGLGLLIMDEGRKAAVRRWPGGLLAKFAW